MEDWFRSREYAYLLSLLQDEYDIAVVNYISADANDIAKIGRLQATIKYLRWMTEDMKEQVMQEVREAENARA